MAKVSVPSETEQRSKITPIPGQMPAPGWLKSGETLQPRDERGYAVRSDVEKFAHSLTMAHLHCRELGHNWRPWVARYDDEHNSYERALRCTRCRTERWETIGLTGAKQGIQYRYPEGYVCELGRIVGEGRDAMRMESLTRMLQDPNVEHGEQREKMIKHG